ncbi:cytochrome c3 family protein [Adlercreutzia agrestimuris]|uniref:cytochrome c-type protein Cgr1 n=1 Tax=Adlercreutzia agrestimuris TaxID=2941324 RepID=UPI00203FC212|nr:cytochrome c3 family protein [Adlercreutzia agrestimuris]
MSEETKVEAATEATASTDSATKEAAPKKGKKKWPIVVGIVVVVLIAAGAGFWVWHEQPSFCNAICHTPMDPYNQTYDQADNTAGVDKWGNEVSNTHSMLAVTHKASVEDGGAGATCMSCHVPQLSEQISEGMNWVTGNYVNPLEERSLEDLVEARGIPADEFCLNAACHSNGEGGAMTRDDLIALTADMERNPHVAQHGANECSDCHKAHRASVNECSQCHNDADIPEGWISVADEKKLNMPA